MRGKPILAALFVLATAFVLSIPLRDTGDPIAGSANSKTSPTSAASPTQEPTPEESESPGPDTSPTPEGPEAPPDTAELAGEYPDECLERESAPDGDGFLAIDQGQGIEISDTEGGGRVVVDDTFPFKWSPSGTYLAGGSGALYDIDGNEVGPPFPGEPPFNWAWSPIADCLIVSSADQTLVIVPGSDAVPLHDGPLARFAFSPSGGDLAYTEVEDGRAHIWVASLADGKARRLKTFPLASDRDVLLAGWAPTGGHVLFWRGNTDAFLEEGVPLYAVSADRNVSTLGTVLAHRDFVAHCGDDLLGVVGGGARINANSKVVARLAPGSEPEVITPEGSHDVSPTCSPDAEFIALIRSNDPNGQAGRRLTVVAQDGQVEFQPSDQSYRDSYPLWGRGTTGVLFIRQRPQSGDPEVWHVSTESSAEPTGVTLRAVGLNPEVRRDSWGHFIDWSADRPSGVNVVSEL